MRVDHNVFILGAGFSAEAGVPTTARFLQAARENMDSTKSPLPKVLEDHYRRVFEARRVLRGSRDSLMLDLDNIETLFSLLDMAGLVSKNTKSSQQTDSIKHVIADTVTRVSSGSRKLHVRLTPEASLDERLKALHVAGLLTQVPEAGAMLEFEISPYTFFLAMLGGLFDPPTKHRKDTVISFNYDTVLESAAASLGGSIEYGITRAKVQSPPTEKPHFVVPVHKLHGSANWTESKSKGVRANIYREYSASKPNGVPLLVPPTWKKGDLSPLFAEIWGAARAAIASAKRIWIIGYSMPETDPFFRHLMAAGLSENEGLYNLTIVDKHGGSPTASSVEPRYRAAFKPLEEYGRLGVNKEGFVQFLAGFHHQAAASGRCKWVENITVY